jgi:hypothetical protein
MTLEKLATQSRLNDIAEIIRTERGAEILAKRAMMSEAGNTPIPRATYRLQFHKGFGFRDAAALAPYLARIGISHVYASPYLKARPDSARGYDIVDHGQLNPELGNETAFRGVVKEFDLFVLTMANASSLSPNAITAMPDSRHHV